MKITISAQPGVCHRGSLNTNMTLHPHTRCIKLNFFGMQQLNGVNKQTINPLINPMNM